MEIINKPNDMQVIALKLINKKSVGFVPTMGALHKGHLSLISTSLSENDITVVSIFVNPTQFAPNEDHEKYPRTIKDDIAKLENIKVDYLFLPEKADIYPANFQSYVEIKELSNKLCGISRPHHFRGVTTICTKLFNIALPTVSYFGQKDYQQALVLKKLVKDLNFPTKVKVLPIVREEDGLALSSRNYYLSADERKDAIKLYKSLQEASKMILRGEQNCMLLKKTLSLFLTKSSTLKIDYISICNPYTLAELNYINSNEILIAIGVYFGKTRLIDNMLIHLSN